MIPRLAGLKAPSDGFVLIDPDSDDEDFQKVEAEEFQLEDFVVSFQLPDIQDDYVPHARKGTDLSEIDLDGRKITIYGIHEEEEIDDFREGLGQLVEPVVDLEDLKTAINGLKIEILSQDAKERAKYLFKVVDQSLTPLELLEKTMGEELYKKMSGMFPIKWKLAKENVPKLHALIESYTRTMSPEKKKEVIQPYARFREVKDYIVEEEFFFYLNPLVTKSLRGYSRLETIKNALRIYFRIENMVKNISEEMLNSIKQLKKRPSAAEKDALIKRLDLSEEKQFYFLEALEMLLDDDNKILLAPIATDSDEEDVTIEPDEIDLAELEAAALHTLDNVCHDNQVAISFQKEKKTVNLGALPHHNRGAYFVRSEH